MKKQLSVFCGMISVLLLAGCKNFLNSDFLSASKVDGSETGIYIRLIDGTGSRTALPSYEWGDFIYELWGSVDGGTNFTQLGKEVNGVITRKAFSNYYNADDPVVLPVPATKWVFRLKGFLSDDMTNDTNPVIMGTTDEYDLTSGKTLVTFKMYPCTGLTGEAEVTVTFPAGTVSSVKACVTSNPVAVAASLTLTELEIVNSKSAVYSAADLPSATKQYARIFVYDSNGDLLCDFAESLVIVGGQTSTSAITLTADNFHCFSTVLTLKKDGSNWIDCPYLVTVTNDDGSTYEVLRLKDSTTGKTYDLTRSSPDDGTYTGTLPEGTYTVVMQNSDGTLIYTGATVDLNSTEVEADFGTVTLPSDGAVKLTPTDTSSVIMIDENTCIIPSDEKMEVTVSLNPGYEASSDSNSDGKKDVTIGTAIVNIGETTKIAAGTTVDSSEISGASVITYNITYKDTDPVTGDGIDTDIEWNTGYSAPSSFSIEDYAAIILPTISNVQTKTVDSTKYVLDGWVVNGSTIAKITADTFDILGSSDALVLTAKWKASVSSQDPTAEEEASGIKGTIYANGINLIIDWDSSAHNYTYVYVDINNDGVFNASDGDYQVTGVTNNDFSNYVLNASSYNSEAPASDFTFTMNGGKIASLVGLGKDASNVSTVNISGYSVIGDGSTIGIDLTSLTNECVNITGQMSGEYSITLLTGNKFTSSSNLYKVAYINNSSYAQMSKFICLYKEDKEEQQLGLTNVTENSVTKTIIYLADPSPISLPSASEANGVIWVETDGVKSSTDFTLGDTTKIQIPCSVFSITVTNGTFELQQTSMKDSDGNEVATSFLGQTGTDSYDDNPATGTSYIYMHMFSTANEITAETATAFLKTVLFKKTSSETDISISINLETVPWEHIEAMDDKGTFSYYDGSFYLGVTNTTDWVTAYNSAKSTIFNGLNGYLLTITSAVENNYINGQMGLEKCWIGGSRMYPKDGAYDADTYTIESEIPYYYKENDSTTKYSKFYWQCGPEAGQWFQDGKLESVHHKEYQSWWNGYYEYNTGYTAGDTNGYTNWETGEPNNSLGSSSDVLNVDDSVPETTVQFHQNGQWNDLKYNMTNDDYRPTGYIVEFRPYTNSTTGTKQKANYQSISQSMSY